MALKRDALVAPFSVRTPLLTQKNAESTEIGTAGVSRPHLKWFQSIEVAVNSSPQLVSTVPANSGAPGQLGEIAFDANWLYGCVAKNTWRRVAWVSF